MYSERSRCENLSIKIKNRIICTPSELSFLRDYLLKTPVSWIVNCIDMGAQVTKSIIETYLEIGNLKTIWGDLGGIKSSEKLLQDKYLVNQVLQILKMPECKDDKLIKKIICYKKLYEKKKLKLVITLKEIKGDFIFMDRNARTASCYEYNLEKSITQINFNVFIISQASRS